MSDNNDITNDYYNNDSTNVRNPDPIKIDRLVDTPFELSEDVELNRILELSRNEVNEFNNSQDIYEKNVINNLIKETQERSEQFASINQKLSKMILFDKENTHIYETILTAIELYIEGYITQYKTNNEEFNRIFRLIKTIRLTNAELNYLHNLIIMEEE